jgi:hypothetical protein
MVNADYRLGSAEGKMGPKIGKVNPFKNTGININEMPISSIKKSIRIGKLSPHPIFFFSIV